MPSRFFSLLSRTHALLCFGACIVWPMRAQTITPEIRAERAFRKAASNPLELRAFLVGMPRAAICISISPVPCMRRPSSEMQPRTISA